jgi:hypothetical protein
VRAEVIHHTNTAAAITEGNQFFTKKHQSHWRSVIAQFTGFGCWNPILTHKVTHDCSGAYPGHVDVVLFNTHKFSFVYKLINFGELV